jgi:hypothetical protein
MKIKEGIQAGMFQGLLAIMVILTIIAMLPTEGKAGTAETICLSPTATADYDSDGIPDSYECNGFTLPGGTAVIGYQQRGTNARANYLDPSGKDLFVLLSQTSLIYNISNLLGYISNTPGTPGGAGGGLGVTTHLITDPTTITAMQSADQALNRNLTNQGLFWQKAVKETELSEGTATVNCSNITAAAVVLGTTNPLGVNPNNVNLSSTIYTTRTKNFVSNLCACGQYCYDYASGVNSGKTPTCTAATCIDPLITLYQKQNIVHEIGHTLVLAPGTSHHYTSQATYAAGQGGSIMESSAYYYSYKSGGKTYIEFRIPTIFDGNDPSNIRLK